MIEEKTGATAKFVFKRHQKDEYFVAYRDFLGPSDTGKYMHLYNHTFQKRLNSQLNVFEYFFDKSIDFEAQHSQAPIYLAAQFGNQKIAVTSTLFTGFIAIIDEDDLSEKKIGQQNPEAYLLLDKNESNFKK